MCPITGRGKKFHQERESTVVLLISYYSVQPDKSSFAFSLNHTTCELRERNITRSVTTGMIWLISVCTGFADRIPSTLRSFLKKVQCIAKYCLDKLHPKKVSYFDY